MLSGRGYELIEKAGIYRRMSLEALRAAHCNCTVSYFLLLSVWPVIIQLSLLVGVE